jgi:hypothetical protein
MRTTVTLDPDVDASIKRVMRERGVSFKEAVNDAIRAGVGTRRRGTGEGFPTYDMGEPLVDITKALRLASELEDDALAARLARGT